MHVTVLSIMKVKYLYFAHMVTWIRLFRMGRVRTIPSQLVLMMEHFIIHQYSAVTQMMALEL